MGEHEAIPSMDMSDFVGLERDSDVKHEWLDGTVVAMGGGTPAHARIALAVAGSLREQLRGRRCCVFGSDLAIYVESTKLLTYPDVSVVCGEAETFADNPNAVTNPSVLVEVLSPSTEAHDRGAKAMHYRRIPSLREYVLVATDEERVEVHAKGPDGHWVIHEALAGEQITLPSIDATLDVDEVYLDPLSR